MHFHQSLEEAAVTQAEPQNGLEITSLMKAILWEELGSMFCTFVMVYTGVEGKNLIVFRNLLFLHLSIFKSKWIHD